MPVQTAAATTRMRRFRAMGSTAMIQVVGQDPRHTEWLVEQAVQRVRHLEAIWSRFVPTSDISRLNGASGAALGVHPDTTHLIVAMVDGWRLSGGAYDPTLLGALNALGYATDWADPSQPSCSAVTDRRGDPGAIRIDVDRDLVQLPFGTSLDAGGIGKGLAADLVTGALLAGGADGALVDIGGDVCVRGQRVDGNGWRIGVADPADDRAEIAQLCLLDGGIATSSTRRRRWQHCGETVHHLLDPATGAPARAAAVQATVVAGTAALAEVWSKAIMVRGASAVHPLLDASGLAAMTVEADGSVRCTESWSCFATESAAVQR